uniref:Uncharacterized protein n=1 Tax=Bursaphelenchus xylophilus TaxID=6326 RepID=A0A1I7SDJ7_BURXY
MLFSDDDPPVIDVRQQSGPPRPVDVLGNNDPLSNPLEPTQEVDLDGPTTPVNPMVTSTRPAIGSQKKYGERYGQQRQDSDVAENDYRTAAPMKSHPLHVKITSPSKNFPLCFHGIARKRCPTTPKLAMPFKSTFLMHFPSGTR